MSEEVLIYLDGAVLLRAGIFGAIHDHHLATATMSNPHVVQLSKSFLQYKILQTILSIVELALAAYMVSFLDIVGVTETFAIVAVSTPPRVFSF